LKIPKEVTREAVNKRMTDNAVAKIKRKKEQIMIYKFYTEN
jgi:hypothetical protein